MINKDFDKSINKLVYSKSIRDVFNDIIDAILYGMIIQDGALIRRNPIRNYKGEEPDFINCMETLGDVMENGGRGLYDGLGDLFMEYLSFGKNGQFFTPQSICDMVAQMQIKEHKNGQTVCDPTCGSGRMLLAAAKINRELYFYGSDIDLLCVKMSVLNLALNNLRGEIVWGDPLRLEVYASFKIEREILTGFPIIYTSKNSDMFGRLNPKSDEKPIEKSDEKPTQLKLFE